MMTGMRIKGIGSKTLPACLGFCIVMCKLRRLCDGWRGSQGCASGQSCGIGFATDNGAGYARIIRSKCAPELLVHAAVKLTSTRKTEHRAIATRVSQLANWRIPIIQTSQSQHSLEYGKDPDAHECAYASTIFHRVQTVGHTISAEGKRAIPHPFHRLD